MTIQRLPSVRALLLMLALSSLSIYPAHSASAARVPNVKGHWSGSISSQATGTVPFELDITKQNRTSGKVSGTISAFGRESRLKGVVKKNGATLTFKTFLNDSEEVRVTLKVKGGDDPNSASGTFKAKSHGQVVAEGTVELHRAEM